MKYCGNECSSDRRSFANESREGRPESVVSEDIDAVQKLTMRNRHMI